MWDGLLDLLTEWFSGIWCWVLSQLFDMGLVLIKIFASIWPSWEVPSWLMSFTWDPATLNLLSLFFPFFTFFFVLNIVISLELTLWVGIPLYRLIVDLL